ncbi:MAG TPA: hypothetical protein VN253_29075 [Kofleriaceae bacterium]|nr:hypothetical protein [Kofleriaceae bacterium]
MTSVSRSGLLGGLWADFIRTTPQAERIRSLLADRGEVVHHDHIGLRTFAAPELGLGLDALACRFEAEGWRPRERYRLDAAHLRARYWQHDDPDAPKIFISELDVARLSPSARAIIHRLLAELPAGFAARPDLAWAGRPWTPSRADYEALLAENEHAARLATLGFRVDHVTLDVAALITFPDLDALTAFLTEHAFRVELKRRPPRVRPDSIPIALADAAIRLPSGSYELADRRSRRPPARYFPVSVAK